MIKSGRSKKSLKKSKADGDRSRWLVPVIRTASISLISLRSTSSNVGLLTQTVVFCPTSFRRSNAVSKELNRPTMPLVLISLPCLIPRLLGELPMTT
ncbi:hypothetical protein D3C84_609200 [compost metagenome]